MQYRSLGKTGLELSNLGFGMMRLPMIDNDYGKIDEILAEKLILHGIDNGINWLDSGYSYHMGKSEPFMGRVVKKNGLRDKILLATKLPVWEVRDKKDFGRLLHEQLDKLQTDHIDLYLLHALSDLRWAKVRDLGVGDFLDKAISDGKIRAAGFSFHDELSAFKTIVDQYNWSFCYLQYNYMDSTYQAGTEGLKLAAGAGMGVVAMEPVRGGSLARAPKEVLEAFTRSGKSWSPVEWALRWVWNHPEISGLLSGMNAMEQVEENLRVAGSAGQEELSKEDLAIIELARKTYKARIRVNCTKCGYCMPCPAGVQIPRILEFFNNRHIFDDKRGGTISYTMLLTPEQRADKCVSCGQCESKCPQHIGIIEALSESHKELS
ncbi:MAG: aldo/keto reductase [Candidatus Wallbacteria bacterium]|nr:aldo/keto reductase [Candidatus Wallbacteria bacterium]